MNGPRVEVGVCAGDYAEEAPKDLEHSGLSLEHHLGMPLYRHDGRTHMALDPLHDAVPEPSR